MTTSNDIKSNLDQLIGTTQYFKHQLGIHFTDGIKYLADSCQCYWLIDIVASWQFDSIVKDNDFQVYKLIVNENHSAVVRIEDGNDKLIQLQMIEFTDFPLDCIRIVNHIASLSNPVFHGRTSTFESASSMMPISSPPRFTKFRTSSRAFMRIARCSLPTASPTLLPA